MYEIYEQLFTFMLSFFFRFLFLFFFFLFFTFFLMFFYFQCWSSRSTRFWVVITIVAVTTIISTITTPFFSFYFTFLSTTTSTPIKLNSSTSIVRLGCITTEYCRLYKNIRNNINTSTVLISNTKITTVSYIHTYNTYILSSPCALPRAVA